MKIAKVIKKTRKADATVGEKLIKICNRSNVGLQDAKYGFDAITREASRILEPREADEIEDKLDEAEELVQKILTNIKKIRSTMGA